MISWRDGEERLHRGSLFAAFAALARGEAWSFPALRPHQREAWHAFTVQCAAMAMIRAGADTPPEDEAKWREMLVALADGQAEAWELVVDDWSKPALLQPPVAPGRGRSDYKKVLRTPDALDMLVTSRNHDVKQERIAQASAEDWLFALVTLQTMEGSMGRGNYGISRMNGGLSSRMALGIRPQSGGASAAFRRDVRELVASPSTKSSERGTLALSWLPAWDGSASIGFIELQPLYVDVCRRIRLQQGPDGLEAWAGNSERERIAADHLGGNTADPWAPMIIDTKKDRATYGKPISLTAPNSGFDFRTMARLLNRSEVTRPLLAELYGTDDVDGLTITATALVRGQGKTEGLHRRAVRISRLQEIEDYGPEEERALDKVGYAAHRRSIDAGEAKSILRRSLICLVQGGPEKPRFDDDASLSKIQPWLRQFDKLVDDEFFSKLLWAEAAGDPLPHRTLWRKQLREWAEDVLADADKAAPHTAMRRVKAVANARSWLEKEMNSWLGKVADGE